jgi:hypothetical protein
MRDIAVMNESDSDILTSSEDDCPTLTSSTMTDTIPIRKKGKTTVPHVEHHPIPGGMFIIRTKQEPRRYLGLDNGKVRALDELPAWGGCHWECVKQSGWYGFRNVVSGRYLGHDTKGNIIAKVLQHNVNEYFKTDREVGGGYALQSYHGNDLAQVGISKDGKSLIDREEEAEEVTWDFIDASCFGIPIQL